MKIEKLLTDVGADLGNKDDIQRKSSLLVQLFTFCERSQIIIGNDVSLNKKGNLLTLYPEGIKSRITVTAQLVEGVLNDIQHRTKKQAA